MATPTQPIRGPVYNYVWNGSSWVPWSGTAAGGTTNYGDPFPAAGIPIGGEDDLGNFAPFKFDSATGQLLVSSSGGGGGAVTIADGADVAEGATTDAKVVGDVAGTVSAKLRGLSYLWALVIDTVNGWVDVNITNASIAVTTAGAGTGTTTQVAATGANQTLLAANAARLGVTLYNNSTSAVNVKLGAVASSTDFTKRMLPQEYWTPPQNYTGRIDAIYDSGAGSMNITELTA